MEIPSVILPTQYVGQNDSIHEDHLPRWIPMSNYAIWRLVSVQLILPPPSQNGRTASSTTINGLNYGQVSGGISQL